jgi:hypothetical protein
MKKYPEHIKVKNLPEESTIIYKFLAYLDQQGIFLSRYENFALNEVDNPDNVILEFYGIDLVRLGKENVRMLKELQDKQNKRWKQEGLV